MEENELLDVLLETGNVAELNRLLSAFSRRRTAKLGSVELIELANHTAGADYRYPNPEPALRLAVRIELLRRAGRILSLTELGNTFVRARHVGDLDVSSQQATILLGLFLDDARMASNISDLINQFGKGTRDQLEAKTTPIGWEPEVQDTAKILQQLGMIAELDGQLFLSPGLEAVLPRTLLDRAALSEEALWKKLEAQRLRGRAAEEFVVLQEKRRLSQTGRRDLAEYVIRVSSENAGAGYDIQSFETDDSPRYIEVKSSIGKAVRFEWSSGERQFAKDNPEAYWIYFVPLSDLLQDRTVPIFMIRDPIALIRSKRLSEAASSFLVSEVARQALPRVTRSEQLLEWPQ
jgi:hypothetical protein